MFKALLQLHGALFCKLHGTVEQYEEQGAAAQTLLANSSSQLLPACNVASVRRHNASLVSKMLRG